MFIQATEQAVRCTSRTLLYKMITRKDITDASDILRQVQTVRDSMYGSLQVSWKYYVNSQLRGPSSFKLVSELSSESVRKPVRVSPLVSQSVSQSLDRSVLGRSVSQSVSWLVRPYSVVISELKLKF